MVIMSAYHIMTVVIYLRSINICPMLNPHFWAQIGPKLAYFNKNQWFKAEKSSLYGNIEFISLYDIAVTHLRSIIICLMLDLGPNPRFWVQIGPKIAYFNKIWWFNGLRTNVLTNPYVQMGGGVSYGIF